MEIKKSKKADLSKMRNTNFLLGLIAALALIFWLFEWTTFLMKAKEEPIKVVYTPTEEEIVPITQPILATAPPPPADVPPVVEVIEIVTNDTEIEEKEIESQEDNNEATTSSHAGEATSTVVVAGPAGGPPGPPVDVAVATPPPPPPPPAETPPPPPPPVEEKTDENQLFEVAEVQPEFPGGMDALMQYLTKNIKYPSRAQENNIKGTVVCKFVVSKTGDVSQVTVVKSLDPDCDKEAVRVISKMPKWKPGKQSGKPVNCYFTVPVRFVLQ